MRAKLKNPFYGPGNRYYQAGEIVDLPDEVIPSSAERLGAGSGPPSPKTAPAKEDEPVKFRLQHLPGNGTWQVRKGDEVLGVFSTKQEAQLALVNAEEEAKAAGNVQQD